MFIKDGYTIRYADGTYKYFGYWLNTDPPVYCVHANIECGDDCKCDCLYCTDPPVFATYVVE